MTDIPEVVVILDGLIGYQVIFLLLDAIQIFLSTISRSMGQHKAAIKHFLISYFIIGQVLCSLLKLWIPTLQVKAVWLSMVVSVLTYDIWQLHTLSHSSIKDARKIIE